MQHMRERIVSLLKSFRSLRLPHPKWEHRYWLLSRSPSNLDCFKEEKHFFGFTGYLVFICGLYSFTFICKSRITHFSLKDLPLKVGTLLFFKVRVTFFGYIFMGFRFCIRVIISANLFHRQRIKSCYQNIGVFNEIHISGTLPAMRTLPIHKLINQLVNLSFLSTA